MPDENHSNDCDSQKNEAPPSEDGFLTMVPVGMTLENIIDRTGELEHLNELVMLQLSKAGGFTSTESYFSLVQPLLDLLEVEIRLRYYHGMTEQEMKLLVQDWIDQEIAEVRKTCDVQDPFTPC
ncbi:MAG: hypothetical protein LUQ36_10360 [Methanoregula sp.]|jgi:hypothetical protein|nr:hypothetical protein [Methanoregula sp.]